MSPTSTNRSPRLRPTDVGDSDLEVVEARRRWWCFVPHVAPSCLWQKRIFSFGLSRTRR
ncbi:MAG: hypothetical protein K2H04_09000 [Bacteroidaceae bacterium]|nr:hypothetical protein [Bacteroidaceae bacterium]